VRVLFTLKIIIIIDTESSALISVGLVNITLAKYQEFVAGACPPTPAVAASITSLVF
jgi:hypothetical protein